jgi:hypothetical protein
VREPLIALTLVARCAQDAGAGRPQRAWASAGAARVDRRDSGCPSGCRGDGVGRERYLRSQQRADDPPEAVSHRARCGATPVELPPASCASRCTVPCVALSGAHACDGVGRGGRAAETGGRTTRSQRTRAAAAAPVRSPIGTRHSTRKGAGQGGRLASWERLVQGITDIEVY